MISWANKGIFRFHKEVCKAVQISQAGAEYELFVIIQEPQQLGGVLQQNPRYFRGVGCYCLDLQTSNITFRGEVGIMWSVSVRI